MKKFFPFLVYILAACSTSRAETPPLFDSTSASLNVVVQAADDTTLKVTITWGYKTDPVSNMPDTTLVWAGLNQATTYGVSKAKAKIKWPTKSKVLVINVSGYGTFSGHGCVAPSKKGRIAATMCLPWTFVRPQPLPPPEFDSLVVKVTLAPNGAQVEQDVNGKCALWQNNNPTKSIWVDNRINDLAVPACMGENFPIVAQFCAIFSLKDGSVVLAKQNQGNPYCEDQWQDFISQRDI